MSRFIKRFGTKGIPYQIDIVLFKLAMNVIVPDCQISITLKRGDHKSELKNPVVLKDKVARFEKQIISVPTKLYWDEKKQEFLSKIAELQINIKHQKTVKTAGKIEFDAAKYATNEIYSQKETMPLQKCPDPQAKLYFEIRVHELGDYSQYNKPDEEEDERPNRQKQASQQQQQQSAISNRGRDVSPMLPTMDNRSQIQDISQFKDRSVSPINRVESKTVTFGNNNQSYVTKQYDSTSSTSGYGQDPPTSARGYNEFQQQQLQQQQRQLSADANRQFQPGFGGGFNTQPIRNNNESNNGSLKGSQNSDLSSQTEMRNLFKQQKEENATQRTKIQELIMENEGLKSQCDNLKNENQRAKSRIATLESQQSPSITFPSDLSSLRLAQKDAAAYDAQILKLNEEIKALKSKQPKDSRSDDLERQLKEVRDSAEQNQSDVSLRFEREKSVWEKKIKDLEMSLSEEQQRSKDLQSELSRRQKDAEYYRQLSTKNSKLEGENEYALSLQKQLQDQQARSQQTENELKTRVKELTEENARTKKDRELELIDLRRAKTEGDHELAKTSREFDSLKKDNKELTAKLQQAKIALQSYLNKEGTDTTTKSKELQAKLDELNNKLIKLSVERGNLEMERDNLKKEVRSKEDDAARLGSVSMGLEMQLLQTKQMLSDVVNVIMQSGDRDFIDEVEPYFSNQNDFAEQEIVNGLLMQQTQQQQQQQQQPSKQLNQNPTNLTNPAFTTNLVYSQTKTNEMNRSNISADRYLSQNQNQSIL